MADGMTFPTRVKWPDKLTEGILRRSGADQPQTPWRVVLEVNGKVFNPEDLPKGTSILIPLRKGQAAIVQAAVREGYDIEYVDDPQRLEEVIRITWSGGAYRCTATGLVLAKETRCGAREDVLAWLHNLVIQIDFNILRPSQSK